MKKKKQIILCVTSVAVIVATIITVCAVKKKTGMSSTDTGNKKVNKDSISVSKPDIDGNTPDLQVIDMSAVSDDGNALTLQDEPIPEDYIKSSTEGKAGNTATPVAPKTPTDDGQGKGVTIGTGQTAAYNCRTAGHHCDGPETHAYILNLELEGCVYCGSHSCASFYATDQWGHTCYTPSKCPRYDIHNDPANYCQDCKKKCGDGRNGTCVRFVNGCNCPNCGKWVASMTCHTCN